ncbi:E3 ubiquitin/ISG15 ligase TRIM25-like [Rhinoderma darwinii]|uniref:E3 ubiquitin/ISG15 ligase TRIM25-like n=1 Tax=Rhinoderma darwinii TaxID=43563 RepID=UPI003F671374
MASADLRDELFCSICLSIFTDPVTLRCGHNFCRVCIDQVLNTQDGSGVYSCPECREEFQERPALQRNINLHNVAERFLSTQPRQEEITGICCTYCIHAPVPAVKSCLLCEASLCDNHMKVHSKAAEHVLTEPSTSLENRKCSVHKKILEYYCPEDAACICVYCSAEEHRGHRVEKLQEASIKRKKKLRNVLQKLNTKKEKTEERVQNLEERRRKAQNKAAGEEEKVTALFIDIRRRLDILEKRVRSEISRQEEQVSLSLTDVIQKLEIEKDELSRKMRVIEELCNMTDPLTVLQGPDTGDLCDPEERGGDEDTGDLYDPEGGGDVDTDDLYGPEEGGGDEDTSDLCDPEEGEGDEDTGDLYDPEEGGGDEDTDDLYGPEEGGGDEDTGGHDGGDQGVEWFSQISHTLSNIIRGINLIYGEGPADILLDVNTAGNYILISDDLKTAASTNIIQNHPETAERFRDYNQVISGRRFSSGRHYWDVEISGSHWWRVGMCYPSIDRRGCQSYIGGNNKSWSLCGDVWYNNQCSVRYDSKMIPLPQQRPSHLAVRLWQKT